MVTNRPTWDEYFMGMAHYASIRSHDSETKVGCVIVGKPNIIVGVGYNGFCSSVKEDDLPTTRPDKYPFIVHAEANAVSNLVVKQIDCYKAYITHLPCSTCAKLLWQTVRHKRFQSSRGNRRRQNCVQPSARKWSCNYLS